MPDTTTTTPAEVPSIPIGNGYAYERHSPGEIAITHEQGGLHMAGRSESAMVAEIERLRAALEAEQPTPCPECIEQARLLGAGASREARLMARVEELERRAIAPADNNPIGAGALLSAGQENKEAPATQAAEPLSEATINDLASELVYDRTGHDTGQWQELRDFAGAVIDAFCAKNGITLAGKEKT